MNKLEAESIVAVQDAFRKENPGPFAGIAPGVNEAQLSRARRVLDGTEPEDFEAPVVEAAHVGPLTPENEVLTEAGRIAAEAKAARIAAEEKARCEAEVEAARIAAEAEAARVDAEEKARREAEAEAARIAAASVGPTDPEVPTDPAEPTELPAILPAE